jgi:hypothetical protein
LSRRLGRWSTSSFGGSADTSPADLASLGRHVRCCERDRFIGLKSVVDELDKFAVRRFVTSLVLVAAARAAVGLLS